MDWKTLIIIGIAKNFDSPIPERIYTGLFVIYCKTKIL